MSKSKEAEAAEKIKVFLRICKSDVELNKSAAPIKDVRSKTPTRSPSVIKRTPSKPAPSAAKSCLSIARDSKSVILRKDTSSHQQFHTYDGVFGSTSTNGDVYSVVKNMVKSAVDGYNASVIAYGVPCTGKTTTMIGTAEDAGIATRAMNDLFSLLEKRSVRQRKLFHVEMSYIEVYNNHFVNLLASAHDVAASDAISSGTDETGAKEAEPHHPNMERIDIHESHQLGVFLSGSSRIRVEVKNADEANSLVAIGNKNRITRRLKSNASSSR